MPFDSLRHNRVLRDWANEPDAMFAQAWFEAIGYNVYTRESIVAGGKLGIDATKKLPGEGFNPDTRVGALINMDEALTASVRMPPERDASSGFNRHFSFQRFTVSLHSESLWWGCSKGEEGSALEGDSDRLLWWILPLNRRIAGYTKLCRI